MRVCLLIIYYWSLWESLCNISFISHDFYFSQDSFISTGFNIIWPNTHFFLKIFNPTFPFNPICSTSAHSYIDVGSWSSLIFINSSATLYANKSSYVDIPHLVPLCSTHDIIDWDSLLSGPLILCSLASQATLFGTCTLEPAGLISMYVMVSLVTSDLDLDFDYHSLHLFFCFRGFLSFGTYFVYHVSYVV